MRARFFLAVIVAVTLAACSSSPSSPSSTATISIGTGASLLTTSAFGTNPLTITNGTQVTWQNNDSMSHTATSDTGVFSSGQIAPGGTFSFQFTTTGTYTYHCTNHPGMVGVIVVQ